MSVPSGVSKFDPTGGPGKPTKEGGSVPPLAPPAGANSKGHERAKGGGTEELGSKRKSIRSMGGNELPSSSPNKQPSGVRRGSGLSAPKSIKR